MRGRLIVFLVVVSAILIFLVSQLWTLLSLLLVDGSQDRLPRADLEQNADGSRGPPIIPKIIHQTYANKTIPEVWREAQQSCIDLHPDYEYKVSRVARCLV